MDETQGPGFADRVCYGFTHDENGKLIPDPTRADIVRAIFAWHKDGLSLRAITAELKKHGISQFCFLYELITERKLIVIHSVCGCNVMLSRLNTRNVVVNYHEVAHDSILARNQEKIVRCGDNGIFRGLPAAGEVFFIFGSIFLYFIDISRLFLRHISTFFGKTVDFFDWI